MGATDVRPKVKAKSHEPKAENLVPKAGDQPSEEPFVMPLHRSVHNYMIGGVCGGIAHALDWDPTLVRVLYVLLSILSAAFPGFLVYIILWIIMPSAYDY